MLPVNEVYKFRFSEKFLETYKNRPVDWGFGALSYVLLKRSYARELPEGGTEEWWQVVKRVVEGVYTTQKAHCAKLNLPFDNRKAQKSAQRMYQMMFHFRFLPAGRGLWMMGTDYAWERTAACLHSCGFVSTENIKHDFADPFCWLMDMGMLGVGVGFDTKGAEGLSPVIRRGSTARAEHIVEDSREGWVESVRALLEHFAGKGPEPVFDYSKIRAEGEPLRSFGGTAAGPEVLIDLHTRLSSRLEHHRGRRVDSTLICDIANLIGRAVVSGGSRRSAQIALGSPNDEEFLYLKDYNRFPRECKEFRWASNNTIFGEVGMDYGPVLDAHFTTNEIGVYWLKNAQEFSRMSTSDFKDFRVAGINPCGEQVLENRELCCLSEIFAYRCENRGQFLEACKYALIYAKTVSIMPTHDQGTNAVMMRNLRLGCSQSGIQQSIQKLGLGTFRDWCDAGYKHIEERDETYSEWLCVPRSIKRTTVKPGGSTPLLVGATPGQHWPISEYHIRRMEVKRDSPLVDICRSAGLNLVPKPEKNAFLVEFPIKVEGFTRGEQDVTVWEQFSIAAFLQRWWSDNSVSVTVKYHPHEKEDLRKCLETFETQLKSVSMLPHLDHHYELAPYETITKEEYNRLSAQIDASVFEQIHHDLDDNFCSSDRCELGAQ